jgi:hypothetical protein
MIDSERVGSRAEVQALMSRCGVKKRNTGKYAPGTRRLSVFFTTDFDIMRKIFKERSCKISKPI